MSLLFIMRRVGLLVFLVLLSLAQRAAALTAAEWRKQSIYQVMTDRFARSDMSTTAPCDTAKQVYCGGTWKGLISKLDYIQGMGFTAVWISPVTKQMEGETKDGSSYHGFWQQDIWSLNSAFGTRDDLIELSAALHARGMYLMVDMVTNHMAYRGCGSCVDYSLLKPFSSSAYFHPFCFIDYDNQTSVENCWQGSNTVSLPDLRTENSDVRRIWNDWVSNMVSAYSVDGIRMDSAKHVEPSFWAGFRQAAGVYILGEVYNGDPEYVMPYQQYLDGLLDYPSYYWILQAFGSTTGSISQLVDGINTMKNGGKDTSLYGSFIENHDIERFPHTTSDMALVKNAIAFTMLKDGIPIIYQGQEQHLAGAGVPSNREALWLTGYPTTSELYLFIAALNRIRTWSLTRDPRYLSYRAYPVYSDSRTVVMRKGFPQNQTVGVFTNVGASGMTVNMTLTSAMTGFVAGEAVVDVLSCAEVVYANSAGDVTVSTTGGMPRVLCPLAGLPGSGICPGLTVPESITSSSSYVPPTTSAPISTIRVPSSASTGNYIIFPHTFHLLSTRESPNTLPLTPASSAPSSCSATAVPITFQVLAPTVFGDTIKLVGNTSALGSWDAGEAIALSASQYTTSNPLWWVAVALVPASAVQYKFIKVSNTGLVTWESNPNRVFAPPCTATVVSGTWR
ncbi:glycoside hydrolase family 13 protein, partial [Echria macrotheca]